MNDQWDDGHEEDWPDDEFEPDEDDDSLLVECPNCGADVYEDSEQCPACGDYIIHKASAWNDKPLWWILLGLAGIIATVILLSGLI